MIQVSHLTKNYGPRTAVNDLSFHADAGEVVGFLGPNGAGKSTTMKILTGFMPATSGEARVAGYDVFEEAIEVKRNVGYLPETPPVYLDMRVCDYIEYCARLHRVEKGKMTSAISNAIEKTNLGEVRGRLVGNLSKGYRQRVGLAQALVHNPKVLVLDEPTVGLDPKQIIEIRSLIKGLAGEHTVILSSHILPEVTATCQRIIVINKGRIVAEDSIDRLTSQMNRKGLVYALEVRELSSSGIEAIKRISGVTGVEILAEKNLLTIELNPENSQARESIIEAAVQNKMGVREFAAQRLSLEEVFLQLTTEENAS
jgi:ABC-2 type transport system ATP-binding protein